MGTHDVEREMLKAELALMRDSLEHSQAEVVRLEQERNAARAEREALIEAYGHRLDAVERGLANEREWQNTRLRAALERAHAWGEGTR